jgi:hypothetical protein
MDRERRRRVLLGLLLGDRAGTTRAALAPGGAGVVSMPLVAQCDRCQYVLRVPTGMQLPKSWESTLLGEVHCPTCVERLAEMTRAFDEEQYENGGLA